MLKEIIAFVDKYDENYQGAPPEKDWSGEKFFIIKTKECDDELEYDGFEILDDDEKIADWIDKNKHYEKIIKNPSKYVLPSKSKSAPNKALGSNSGLATYCFFAFKLSEKNLGNLMKKIEKTKFPNDLHKGLIENIHKILKDMESEFTKKSDNVFTYLDLHVLIHTNKKQFIKWEKITCDFIRERLSQGKTSLSINKGECFVCNKKSKVSTPIFLTNYDEKKIFLKHKTRYSKDGKGIPLRACDDCVIKSGRFETILNDYKIKIFPLFVEPDKVLTVINLIDSDLEENQNKFNFILKELTERYKKNIFDFYLVVLSRGYFFFDYIAGYKWTLGNYVDFYTKNERPYPITRAGFEQKLSRVLCDKPKIEYFDKIKGADSQQTSMLYTYRQKIFDFVYRNKNTLTEKDIENIVLFRIEKSIRNSYRSLSETFNLFFNRNLLLQNKNSDKNSDTFLNHIRTKKEQFLSENIGECNIENDDEWAYFAGQMAYYLVSLSKSKDKTYGLLEPFTNKSTIKHVKKTIEELIDRYRHEINLNNKRFRKVMTSVLSYKTGNSSFLDLKILFYVGAFDDNLIYYKKEEK